MAAPVKKYQELLDAEIEADRATHGKKPLKENGNDDDAPPTKTVTESTRDPECGLFHKGEHEKQFAYVSNTACDRHGFFKKYEYAYDEFYDCYVCPQNQILKYSTTNREGYREYKSNPKICKSCPSLESCTLGKEHQKTVNRHVWQEYVEEADHYRYVPEYRDIYKWYLQKFK